MLRSVILGLALLCGLVGCAEYTVPKVGVLGHAPVLDGAEAAALEALRPPLPDDPLAPVDLADVRTDFEWLEQGETLTGGIRVTRDLADFQRAKLGVDTDRALAMLARYEAGLAPDEALAHFMVTERRATLLMLSARPLEAARELPIMEEREIALHGSNLNSMALRGHLRFWRNDPNGALAYYGRVLVALGDWRVPTFYWAYPTNLEQLLHFGFTRVRALLGVSFAYLIKGDHERAMAWAQEFHRQVRDILGVFENPIYGLLIKPPAEIYFGYGWAVTSLASARAAFTRNLAANEHLFDAALRYFEAAGAADGPLIVDCLREYAAFNSGIAALPTRRIGVLPEGGDDWWRRGGALGAAANPEASPEGLVWFAASGWRAGLRGH